MADNKQQKDRLDIAGPGAADFIAAEGGTDQPGGSRTKGTGQVQDEGPLGDARRLEPRLADESAGTRSKRGADDERHGSQTGTIGGGGPEAHNDSPVRATGVDDPSVSRDQRDEQD